ncbi:MAG: helix-turn-helix transcriptional regulator [Mariprofundaceae bacterium]|nr:helix-turn-helix transcriptional regulator [Mariprofundaceae bacterium]
MDFVADCVRMMEEQGVNRSELARRMGVSRAYITKLLNGNANITLDTMVRVAMALDARVNLAMAEKNRRVRWFSCVDGGRNRLMKRDGASAWGGKKFVREDFVHERITSRG